jgi:hypothetical protein
MYGSSDKLATRDDNYDAGLLASARSMYEKF